MIQVRMKDDDTIGINILQDQGIVEYPKSFYSEQGRKLAAYVWHANAEVLVHYSITTMRKRVRAATYFVTFYEDESGKIKERWNKQENPKWMDLILLQDSPVITPYWDNTTRHLFCSVKGIQPLYAGKNIFIDASGSLYALHCGDWIQTTLLSLRSGVFSDVVLEEYEMYLAICESV